MKLLPGLILMVAGALVVAFYFVNFYNNLVTQTEAIEAQWAQVENQYQRRFDLIPNLVNSVKGFFEQEQEVFGAIAEARTRYAGAEGVDEKAAAASQLESSLGRLLVIVESYPELKSDQAVQGLMDELAGTENRIAVERRRYNELVRDYNTKIRQFPGNLIAPMFGFDAFSLFEAAEGAEVAPEVEL